MSLYFNLDDEEDRLIWEHLEKRKKSNYVKRLIINDILGVKSTIRAVINDVEATTNDDILEVITDDDEVLDDFDELNIF